MPPPGLTPLVKQERRPWGSRETLGPRGDPCPRPANTRAAASNPTFYPEARHLPVSVPRRFPWLKPNSQAKVSQHSSEITLQQYILALKVPVETVD